MKELNKRTLMEALSTLPEYEPPAELWQRISPRLNDSTTTHVQDILPEHLPEYEPPAQVWDQVVQELDRGAKIRFTGLKRALALAASFGLLLLVYSQLNRKVKSEPDSVRITYSEMTLDSLLMVRDWNEDEEAFLEYLDLCKSKKYICEKPEFKLLQEELEELTLAKEELNSAIGLYGSDPNLLLQIKEIELERNDLLKKMMVMLI